MSDVGGRFDNSSPSFDAGASCDPDPSHSIPIYEIVHISPIGSYNDENEMLRLYHE